MKANGSCRQLIHSLNGDVGGLSFVVREISRTLDDQREVDVDRDIHLSEDINRALALVAKVQTDLCQLLQSLHGTSHT